MPLRGCPVSGSRVTGAPSARCRAHGQCSARTAAAAGFVCCCEFISRPPRFEMGHLSAQFPNTRWPAASVLMHEIPAAAAKGAGGHGGVVVGKGSSKEGCFGRRACRRRPGRARSGRERSRPPRVPPLLSELAEASLHLGVSLERDRAKGRREMRMPPRPVWHEHRDPAGLTTPTCPSLHGDRPSVPTSSPVTSPIRPTVSPPLASCSRLTTHSLSVHPSTQQPVPPPIPPPTAASHCPSYTHLPAVPAVQHLPIHPSIYPSIHPSSIWSSTHPPSSQVSIGDGH